MEIVVGKLAGFCGGVVNSVTKTEDLLNKYKRIYCLGELVHNKQVVDKLKNKGLDIIESLDDALNDSKVIIRAHGVPKKVYDEARERNIQLIDLTCPNVLKIHEQAISLVDDKNYIILIAQKDHPEAIGTISFCGEYCDILENNDDLNHVVDRVKNSDKKKVAIISQTTFSVARFDSLVNELSNLLSNNYEIEVFNTICSATELRQKETKVMATDVDAMIIIGGKNSSNTKKLYELSCLSCNNTFIIETIDDLKEDLSDFKKVGIMAGASTPKESINDVVDYLNLIYR